MPHMYILECADGRYYTGSTWNLDRRLREHQAGEGANYTAKRLPVKLVYCEYYDRVEDAFFREKQVQGWSRRKKQALIAENYEKLVEYSRNYTQYPPSAELDLGELGLTVEAAGEHAPSTPLASASSAAGEHAPSTPLPELVEGSGFDKLSRRCRGPAA